MLSLSPCLSLVAGKCSINLSLCILLLEIIKHRTECTRQTQRNPLTEPSLNLIETGNCFSFDDPAMKMQCSEQWLAYSSAGVRSSFVTQMSRRCNTILSKRIQWRDCCFCLQLDAIEVNGTITLFKVSFPFAANGSPSSAARAENSKLEWRKKWNFAEFFCCCGRC